MYLEKVKEFIDLVKCYNFKYFWVINGAWKGKVIEIQDHLVIETKVNTLIYNLDDSLDWNIEIINSEIKRNKIGNFKLNELKNICDECTRFRCTTPCKLKSFIDSIFKISLDDLNMNEEFDIYC